MTLNRSIITLTILSLLSQACSQYDIAINKNVIYSPPLLLSNFQLADKELRQCVEKTIREKNITDASQLNELLCGPGKIEQLNGLETFSAIERLGLSKNNITDLTPLTGLPKLAHLDVSNNTVVDASPVMHHTPLRFLDLRKNSKLKCASTASLKPIKILHLPEHCR